jgi:Tfp pilus assembly protein PilX
MIIKKIKKNRGFVLLFAMVLSSIILAVALGVTNIALKEVNFSTSGKDANDAFFAADTGVECALFYDKNLSVTDPFPTPPTSVTCADNPVIFTNTNPWSFIVSGLGSSGNSCAVVNITKDVLTTIISKGYNVANTGDNNCEPTSKSVERELDVNY